MQKKRKAKEKIMKILDEHPEGPTIQRVADLTRMSRITATKYIDELLGKGKIRERKVGVARLLFSKKKVY